MNRYNDSGTWGSILKLKASISGTALILTATKKDGIPWISSGKLYFKVGTYKSFGSNRKTINIYSGNKSSSYTHNMSSFDTYPKRFYVRYDANSGGYAWVGPIIIITENK